MLQRLPTVSIIVPAYNVGSYISETISSVLSQTYTNWELLVVNDGSTDDTEEIVKSFSDTRIRYFHQENKGVGAARNLALKYITGTFFCFLDGDDVFPPASIESRITVFSNNPDIDFVDGVVVYKSEDLQKSLRKHTPAFTGQPYAQLLRINPACLFGNTWMIRRKANLQYRFNEHLTHAEDLYFYLTVSKQGGNYTFTEQEILWYRQRSASAMKNIKGLEEGYKQLYRLVKKELQADKKQLWYLKYKITRIMFATYLKGEQKPYDAIRSLVENLAL